MSTALTAISRASIVPQSEIHVLAELQPSCLDMAFSSEGSDWIDRVEYWFASQSLGTYRELPQVFLAAEYYSQKSVAPGTSVNNLLADL